MTFPSVTSAASSARNGTSTFAATMPSDIASGDLLVAFVWGESGNTWSATGYTVKDNVLSNAMRSYVFYRLATGSGDDFSLDRSAGAGWAAVTVYRFRGITGGSAALETTYNVAVGTVSDCPSITASWGAADNLFLTFFRDSDAGAYPTGYSLYQQRAGESGYTGFIRTSAKESTSATDDPASLACTYNYMVDFTAVVRGAGGSQNLTGNAAAVATATGTLTHGVPLTGSAAGAAAATGNLTATHFGILTTPPLKNNAGTVLANETGVTAHVYSMAGGLIVTKTGQTTSATGVMVITDPALSAATQYRVVIVLASGAEGLAKLTSV